MGIGNVIIWASAEIWNFFSRFSVASPTEIESASEDLSPQIFLNSAGGDQLTIKLSAPVEKINIMVFSFDGRRLISENYTFYGHEIPSNISEIDAGIFFLRLTFPIKVLI